MVETPIMTRKKDPGAKLDYGVDWSRILPEGATIATSTWAIDGPDSELTASGPTHDDTQTSVRLSGGTAGVDYDATNHVVYSDGQEDDRTIRIECRQR